MNEKKLIVSLIIKEMAKVAGVKFQRELAGLFGIENASISSAKQKGTIPKRWYSIIEDKFGVNEDDILKKVDQILANQSTKPGTTQTSSGTGDNLAFNSSQLNGVSFNEQGNRYKGEKAGDTGELIKELGELRTYKAEQEQRPSVKNINLRLIVEWMDNYFVGDREGQSVSFSEAMSKFFPSCKAFMAKKQEGFQINEDIP